MGIKKGRKLEAPAEGGGQSAEGEGTIGRIMSEANNPQAGEERNLQPNELPERVIRSCS
ncbi:MAG TPA: hypothetical protein VE870_03370 [Bacteroidales bacterium]|nr:hypothetical protein [Bacteroidales bacterium]